MNGLCHLIKWLWSHSDSREWAIGTMLWHMIALFLVHTDWYIDMIWLWGYICIRDMDIIDTAYTVLYRKTMESFLYQCTWSQPLSSRHRGVQLYLYKYVQIFMYIYTSMYLYRSGIRAIWARIPSIAFVRENREMKTISAGQSCLWSIVTWWYMDMYSNAYYLHYRLNDHLFYFDQHVSVYGQAGCKTLSMLS